MIVMIAVYSVLIITMLISGLRIRQGFNEGNNTPIATLLFCLSLALLCSLEWGDINGW